MINLNKKWLLVASPWRRRSLQRSTFAIFGGIFTALLLLCAAASKAAPIPLITGNTTICIGTNTTLTGSPAGGTWVSGNTSVATINAAGLAGGVAGGIATVTYTVGASSSIINVTVTYPISGPTTVCLGNTIKLVDSTPTGLWSSSSNTTAAIDVTGNVSGIAPGTVTVTYGRVGACSVTQTINVVANPVPAITRPGALAICNGGSITITDPAPGGAWSSSNPTIATIDPVSGLTTGLSAGASVITYTSGGCYVTAPLAITATSGIAPITGATSVCAGNTAIMAETTPYGIWSSSNNSVALIYATGSLIGISPGTATISYSKGGCSVSTIVIVNSNSTPAITGSNAVCVGSTTALSDATSGGAWSCNYTALATIDPITGVVTGVAPGSVVMTYAIAGSCYQTFAMTVNSASSSVGAITGASAVCKLGTTTLTDAVPGGTWSSSNPAIANVNAYGVVTGVNAGIGSIIYTRMGCTMVQPMTVNDTPHVITGTLSVCINSTTALADITPGGSWASSNIAIATVDPGTGIVGGITAGTANITYTNATGCFVSKQVTVNGPAPINGGNTVCIAPTTYLELRDPTIGGTWSGSNSLFATISSTGVVTGVGAGVVTITYTQAVTHCYVTQSVSVNAAPGTITGNYATCIAGTTQLADTSASGTWSSSNLSIATVNAAGVVNGVAAGGVIITYTKNTCYKLANITVNTPAAVIGGPASVCVGLATIALTETTPGGTWSASNANVAINRSGVVTGVSAGTTIISYSTPGCAVTKIITASANGVTTLAGTPSVCTGLTVPMTTGGGAGVWSSANASIATVAAAGSTTGIVTGVSAGTTIITFTNSTSGCFKTAVFSVRTQPAVITTTGGAVTLCNSGSLVLSDATTGGYWSSNDSHIGSISSTGVVSGISAGHITVTYSLPGGCQSYQPLTITPQPGAPVGASAVCLGATAAVYDSVYGGLWASSNTSVATVGSTSSFAALIGGVAAGTATLTYSFGGCSATKTITVGAVTPSFTSSPISICAMGTAKTVTATPASGTWATSNSLVAAISSGNVTGISVGTATISYTVNGCVAMQVETVTANTMPAISGNNGVCIGQTTTLADATSGGTWVSSNTAAASIVSATGVVTGGVAAGATIITYSVSSGGCMQFLSMNVGAITPATITGSTNVCVGATTILGDATAGGIWASSNTAVAVVNSVGSVLGIAAGTTNLTYTINGCYATPVTVNVSGLPTAITGTTAVCVGNITALIDTTTGGTWSSSSTAKATVDASGNVTGVAAGSANILYTLSSGCAASVPVSIGGPGATLTIATPLCGAAVDTMSASVTGGTWSVSNVAVAAVSGTTLTGIGGGTTTVTYATPGCAPVTTVITVNFVAPITGSFGICKNDSTTLSDATSGGIWTTSNTAIASVVTVDAFNGKSYGINLGADTITYTANGCRVTQQVTVIDCGYRAANTTGTQNINLDQVYTLYPNPGNGHMVINQSIVADGLMDVTVMNYLGAVVYNSSLAFAGGSGKISLPDVVPGMYLVVLKAKNGDAHTFKVVIE